LVRHEQGAAHAAQGYARVSGKVGVCLVTSGPGATNTITGIADAMIDSTPIVVIAGYPTHGHNLVPHGQLPVRDEPKCGSSYFDGRTRRRIPA